MDLLINIFGYITIFIISCIVLWVFSTILISIYLFFMYMLPDYINNQYKLYKHHKEMAILYPPKGPSPILSYEEAIKKGLIKDDRL